MCTTLLVVQFFKIMTGVSLTFVCDYLYSILTFIFIHLQAERQYYGQHLNDAIQHHLLLSQRELHETKKQLLTQTETVDKLKDAMKENDELSKNTQQEVCKLITELKDVKQKNENLLPTQIEQHKTINKLKCVIKENDELSKNTQQEVCKLITELKDVKEKNEKFT